MTDSEMTKIFQSFMDTYDLYAKPIPGYQNIQINRLGMVYDNNWNMISPYMYRDGSHYDMIYAKDYNNNPHVIGVHQAVAMTFNPNYYPGCIVHHKDENKYNNWDTNLEIISRSDHSCIHQIKYHPVTARCEVCGKEFIWTPERQQLYYSDLRRGRNRIITCSRGCSSYYGRLIQLGRI